MVCAAFTQNPNAIASCAKFKMGPFDENSGILSAQIGTVALPVFVVAFGLAPVEAIRFEIVEIDP